MDMGKLLGGAAIVGTLVLVGWYLIDPVGLSNTAFMQFLHNLGSRSASRFNS